MTAAQRQQIARLRQDQAELIRRVRRLEESGSRYIADAQEVLDGVNAELAEALDEAGIVHRGHLSVVAA